jgi:hypothetical protein
MTLTVEIFLNKAFCRLLRATWQDILDTRGKKIWRQDDSIVSTYQ